MPEATFPRGSGRPRRVLRALSLIAAALCLETYSASAEWHIPSLFASKSGVTKPTKKGKAAVSPELLASGLGICQDAPKRWMPWPKDFDTAAAAAAPTEAPLLPRESQLGRGEQEAPSEIADDEDIVHLLGVGAALEDIDGRDGGGAMRNSTRSWRSRRLMTVPGFNPLGSMCKGDAVGQPRQHLPRGESLLTKCLKNAKACKFSREDAEEVSRAARALPGVQLLLRRPRCAVVNQKSCPAGSGNKETTSEFQSLRLKKVYKSYGHLKPHKAAAKDLAWQKYGHCAIVGNAPGLKTSAAGASIDRHDTVFRINVIGSGALSLQPSPGTSAPEKEPRYTGKRTTFRIFSKLVAWWLASGKVTIKPKGAEQWLFWHYHARKLLPGIQQRTGGKLPLLMLAPAQINWQLAVYFMIRQDLFKLGVGKFTCPRNINSGVKAIFLATHICTSVDVYGISYTEQSAKTGHFGNSKHQPTRFHAWDFDSTMLRLLHLARVLTICSLDP